MPLDAMDYIVLQMAPNIMAMILSVFIIVLLHNNQLIDKSHTRLFMIVMHLFICIEIIEIIELSDSQISTEGERIIVTLVNTVGIIIPAFIPTLLAMMFYNPLLKKWKSIFIPCIIFSMLALLNIKMGWIFRVTIEQEYQRGPYYFMVVLMMIYGYLLFSYAVFRQSNVMMLREKIYIFFLYFIVLLSSIARVMNRNLTILWLGCSVAMVLYYIFLRELELKIDYVSGLENRKNFEERMLYFTSRPQVTIIMADANNLKYVNDNFGHTEGDVYLRECAQQLKKVFCKKGNVYRIGGDEFCVLTEEMDEDILHEMIQKVQGAVEKMNPPGIHKKMLAMGICTYKKSEEADLEKCRKEIFQVFQAADEKMYQNKILLKKKYGSEGE